jgi:dipeptidyl aminopeptidase/acylaminoacyl peptidase
MRTHLIFMIAVLLTCFAAGGSLAAADKHPYGVDDWAKLRTATAVGMSPDGGTILYEVSFGGEKGPTNHEWWIMDPAGKNPKKLELPQHFEPAGFARGGGALYGTLPVKDQGQLALVGLNDKGAPLAVLTDLARGINSAKLSPDGTRFAVTADPRSEDPLADVRTVIEPDESSLYVVNEDGSRRGWWCGGLLHVSSLAWSLDGQEVAVLSTTPKIGNHFIHSTVDVCTDSGAKHVADIPTAASGMAWADGGQSLAFVSTTTDVLTPDHLWTVAAAGGTAVDRTPKLDASVLDVESDPRGMVWVTVARGVHYEVDSFRDGKLETTFEWPGGVIFGMPVSSELANSQDKKAFTVADPTHSVNVAAEEGGKLERITKEGEDVLAVVELGDVRAVHWTSKEGIALEGIATFPAGYVEGRKYPFLVMPHGGPESNDVLWFDSFPQMFAGLGYVVLQPEYRGSTGYGSGFLQAIYQSFGDRAYHDVDSATDFAIAQGWADPGRLAIYGWSAGGFMTSWTVTQTSRYRAAIEGAGITDWGSFMWTSDVQQIDYDARWPDEDPADFAKFSAVMFAKNVTTPLLILHGAADMRVPTYQGREYYELLAARGKTVRMVTYPGSPHFPRVWEQRRDVFREISAWLAKYNP